VCEEARSAARIDHANVGRILDVSHDSKLTYLVMELIDGRDLGDMLRSSRRLQFRIVLRLLTQVASALSAAMKEGVIHADIKPSNIIVGSTGTTKLVDFGLARAAAAAASRPIGTAGYIAPEQTSDPSSLGFSTDMYSLGVTMYQALLGRLPFPADDPERCAELHRTQPITPLSMADPGIPVVVSNLVMSLLQKDQAARPASYADLLVAIEQCRSHT
jgi:serine/threonine-protein kinase